MLSLRKVQYSKYFRKISRWDVTVLVLVTMYCITLASNFGLQVEVFSGPVEKQSLPLQEHGTGSSPTLLSTNASGTILTTSDSAASNPCLGRPTPLPIALGGSRPPSLFFLHIPKTAGTLMHHIVIKYANRTDGLACQFLFDGNRFGSEHYQMSVRPPPIFPNGSLEHFAVSAFESKNLTEKARAYQEGGCRAIRGHVTYRQRDTIRHPLISFTVIRNPLDRFISMYEFILMMVKTRPDQTGWDRWITGRSLHKEFANSSSILNRGFYDESGEWIATNNTGFSFHFYGVLHQLSGINPTFEGVGDPSRFRMSNGKEMAEKAKDNICGTHILGSQENMNATLDSFFDFLEPYAAWPSEERENAKKMSSVNRNALRKSRDIDDYLPGKSRTELERRLFHEIEVFNFAQEVIRYRKQRAAGQS